MEGKVCQRIFWQDILYVRAEHVYVRIFFRNRKSLLLRKSLRDLLLELPQDSFLQVHRSYIINPAWVSGWNSKELSIEGQSLPISRSRRQFVKQHLLAS